MTDANSRVLKLKDFARFALSTSEIIGVPMQTRERFQDAIYLCETWLEMHEALGLVAENVTWADKNNQSISLTYAIGTVDRANKILTKIEGEYGL